MTTPPDTPKPPAAPIQVMEGVSGTWFYHLGRKGQTTALCGARVMTTQVPLSAWGHVGHLHERWCAKCADLHVAPSPQESHKLAEELERLHTAWDRGLTPSARAAFFYSVDKHLPEILAALRSSPSEQKDARELSDDLKMIDDILAASGKDSLIKPLWHSSWRRIKVVVRAAIAASGGAKT